MEGFNAALNSMPLAVGMTYAQDREMALHAKITQNTGVAIYFCDPHNPWQRGNNEHINELILQNLPKRIDLSGHSLEQLDAAVLQLNIPHVNASISHVRSK